MKTSESNERPSHARSVTGQLRKQFVSYVIIETRFQNQRSEFFEGHPSTVLESF